MVRKNGIVGIGHCCQDTICTVENYPPEDGSTHILSMDDSQGGGAVATAMAAAAKLGADFVQAIGRKFVLYRPAEEKVIVLPR